MRFGISNLVFGQISESARNLILKVSDVCDFAPTAHYGGWDGVPDLLPLEPYVAQPTKISALQSLFFLVHGASLVKDDQSYDILFRHNARLIDLAAKSKIPFLIYGSPGTRAGRLADISERVLYSRVAKIADVAVEKGIKLCFEANSAKFGCEYLTTNAALLEMLSTLSHPGLGLHFDVGQMQEEGIDVVAFVKANRDLLVHLHLSSPDFTCKPEQFELYAEVMACLLETDVDVILEIQKLGTASETQLIDMCQRLAAVSRAC